MRTTFPKIDTSALLDGTGGDKDTEQQAKSGQVNTSVHPVEHDWTKLRRITPLDTLLDSTVRWAEGLPPEVKPHALMAKFPRLANMAAATWSRSSAFHDYLNDLLVDRRGGRKGFPPEILAELKQLRTYRIFGRYKPSTSTSFYREGPLARHFE